MDVFNILFARFGPRHWWPGDTPFEVCVGAILTQNTAWTNVERAIANLKAGRLLDLDAMARCPRRRLAEAVRPSGYYNQKADRLQLFCGHVLAEHGSLEAMLSQDADALRAELLLLKGIGPETADSMVLYAAGKPAFVVDAYTIRIFTRLGLIAVPDYHDVQRIFTSGLPKDAALYNEYHALIVEQGKTTCRKRPLCAGCALEGVCPKLGVGGDSIGGRTRPAKNRAAPGKGRLPKG